MTNFYELKLRKKKFAHLLVLIANFKTKSDFACSDGDDEFVSESYQASSKDIKEANASMKRLGVKGKTFQAVKKQVC